MENFSLLWSVFYGWMPPLLNVLFLAFLVFAAIIVVLKIIAFIWSLLPFV